MTRVVQWATGLVGGHALRQIVDNPDLELAGVWVSGPTKHGKDAGELCGRPSTGVISTSSREEIVELDADVVIHCPSPLGSFDDDVANLLESGKDVISTLSYFSPRTDGDEVMEKMRAACEAGGSTLYGAGLDPGFVCDRVAAMMTGCLAEVHRIKMAETIDISTYAAPELLMDLGFGKKLEDVKMDNEHIQHMVARLFPAAIAKLADQLNLELDEIRLTGMPELLFASKDLDVAIGHLPEGSLSGACYEYGGYRGGEAVITHAWVHFAEREAVPGHWLVAPEPGPGETMPYMARVDIEGRPSLRTDMVFTDPEDTIFLPTAACAVRAIPEVLASPPGLLQERVFGSWNSARGMGMPATS